MPKTTQPYDSTSLLPADEQEEILAKAREEIAKERKEAATKSFLAKALEAERKKFEVVPDDEALTQVLIDLPGFSDGIRVNNRIFHHGVTYTVPMSQARDLQSMMARAWEHENEVGGANRDTYQKPRNQLLRPGMN